MRGLYAGDHQRRRLVPVALPDLVRPLQLQATQVFAVDLIQPAVAPPMQCAVVHEPVVRLVVHDPLSVERERPLGPSPQAPGRRPS